MDLVVSPGLQSLSPSLALGIRDLYPLRAATSAIGQFSQLFTGVVRPRLYGLPPSHRADTPLSMCRLPFMDRPRGRPGWPSSCDDQSLARTAAWREDPTRLAAKQDREPALSHRPMAAWERKDHRKLTGSIQAPGPYYSLKKQNSQTPSSPRPTTLSRPPQKNSSDKYYKAMTK